MNNEIENKVIHHNHRLGRQVWIVIVGESWTLQAHVPEWEIVETTHCTIWKFLDIHECNEAAAGDRMLGEGLKITEQTEDKQEFTGTH